MLRYVKSSPNMSDLGWKVKGQLDLWCLYKTSISIGLTFFASIMISASTVIYRKMNISRFFQNKCIMNQIWHSRKNDQGQPRFIICANLVGPKSPMLYTKSQGHWPFGSRVEDIYRVFTLYGHVHHLGDVTINIWFKFTPLNLRSLHMKCEFILPSDFWENCV